MVLFDVTPSNFSDQNLLLVIFILKEYYIFIASIFVFISRQGKLQWYLESMGLLTKKTLRKVAEEKNMKSIDQRVNANSTFLS